MRLNKVNIITGRRGSGKTELILKLLQDTPAEKRVLIIDTLNHPKYKDFQIIDPQQVEYWRSGVKRILVLHSNLETVFKEVFQHFKNGIVIFEDSTKYIKKSVPDHLLDFILDTKQKNVDLFFVYHSFAAIPPDIFRSADTITTFKTQENLFTSKGKIPNYYICFKLWQKVMQDKNKHKYLTIEIN